MKKRTNLVTELRLWQGTLDLLQTNKDSFLKNKKVNFIQFKVNELQNLVPPNKSTHIGPIEIQLSCSQIDHTQQLKKEQSKAKGLVTLKKPSLSFSLYYPLFQRVLIYLKKVLKSRTFPGHIEDNHIKTMDHGYCKPRNIRTITQLPGPFFAKIKQYNTNRLNSF